RLRSSHVQALDFIDIYAATMDLSSDMAYFLGFFSTRALLIVSIW
ncbi:hypothetical protein EJB05_29151, partial [Eragrostis curvula]